MQTESNLRQYMLAQIRRRKILIISHKSKKNEAQLWKIINQLELWLINYPNANTRQLAKFFLNHFSEIQQLIPGYGSACYEAEMKKLEAAALVNEAVLLKKELFNLKLSFMAGQVKDISQFWKLRVKIASALTYANQKKGSK